ncbi:hypothetical protein NE237_004756 [Protea cynaroides]|uniref:Uncharacterized protein n=1 Tax=Protea cynaroides TaxID=273540 RepID=A0A9Q0KJG8_9MAGN|nr:hypothetical protein NE237_004756 [Protea cynaroides]
MLKSKQRYWRSFFFGFPYELHRSSRKDAKHYIGS